MAGRSVGGSTVVAVLSTVLTAVGHVAGGGTVPDLALLVVLLPLLAVAFVSVAGACRSLLGTVATLAAGQIVLHELMTLLQPAHAMGTGSAASMVGVRAAVTVVTAAALRHADLAVAALAAAVAMMLPRRLAPPPVRRPLRPRVETTPAAQPLRGLLLATAAPRRGPPVRC